jgi:1,4-dihydroxy-2-naphthoyl-CoA hydrolase
VTQGPPDVDQIEALGRNMFPGLLGVEFEEIRAGWVKSTLSIRPDHMAPNGYLHAAVVVGLADTSCGYGCMASLPPGAVGFATIELKTNFIGTTLQGVIGCHAELVHGGRTTQLWDATVTDRETGKTLALFRCTQLLIAERAQKVSPPSPGR